MRHRLALGLRVVPDDVGKPLARIAGIEGLARASITGVVPLTARDALGSDQAVAGAFMLGALLTVFVTLNLARLEQLLARRRVLTLGVGFLAASAILFAWGPSWTIPLAIGMRSAEASIFSVCMSLYMMDFIGKAEMNKAESRRVVWSAVAWIIGPVLGVWLWANLSQDAPFMLSIAGGLALLIAHWYLRYLQNPVLRGPVQPAPSPIRSVPRFFGQRVLRAAYVITLTRSIFWATLFTFGPLYVADAGLPSWAPGAFLSVASGALLMAPIVRRLADAHGVRFMVLRAFVVMGASMFALAVIGEPAPVGVVFWLTGALGGGVIDVLGNIPFLRLVKPRERGPMTAVFSTWREVSFMLAPALAWVVLEFAEFHVVFLVIGVLLVVGFSATTLLPRRLGQLPELKIRPERRPAVT